MNLKDVTVNFFKKNKIKSDHRTDVVWGGVRGMAGVRQGGEPLGGDLFWKWKDLAHMFTQWTFIECLLYTGDMTGTKRDSYCPCGEINKISKIIRFSG